MNILNWIYSPTNLSQLENVCFKGGGIKGVAFVGVDRALTELGVWPQIKRFIGSSAGAIFATGAACRIPHTKMKAIIDTTDFSQFKDTPWGILGEGERIIRNFGLYNGDYFYNWIGNILKDNVGDADITFMQVFEKFNSELVITTTDLTMKSLVYMSKDSHPNLPVRDAVRRSMSIPIFYIPIQEKDTDGINHVYVDGGCTNNFPLDYFDDLYSSKEQAFTKTIGFNLLEDFNDHSKNDINSIIDIISSLLNTDIEEIQNLRLTEKDKERMINIPTFNIKSTDFDISKENIQKLDNSGYDSTIKFFKQKYNI